jgi:ribosomal RNA assembly protein
VIEGGTGAEVSVSGRTVAIIGRVDEVRLAKDAITSLASGSSHSAVYKRLEKARAAAKVERLKLWEDA